jgi:hypothetical protein
MSCDVAITLQSTGTLLDGSHIEIPDDPDNGVSQIVINVRIFTSGIGPGGEVQVRRPFRVDWRVLEAEVDPQTGVPAVVSTGSTLRNAVPTLREFNLGLSGGDCPVLNRPYKLCVWVLDDNLADPTDCDSTTTCAEFIRIK